MLVAKANKQTSGKLHFVRTSSQPDLSGSIEPRICMTQQDEPGSQISIIEIYRDDAMIDIGAKSSSNAESTCAKLL